MKEYDKIVQAIFDAVAEINPQLPEEQRLAPSTDTVLFGESGKLDSLGLVNLIVATEQRLEELFGVTLILADERALSQKRSPFRTIGALAQYASQLLQERENA